MRSSRVAIIGAGPAGLAIAARLLQAGVSCTILERERVGHTWWSQYESLVLNSVKHISHLPGMKMPRGYRLYPTAQEFAEYLEHYAQTLRIPIRLGFEVTSMQVNEGRWVLESGAGQVQCDATVIATGTWMNPHIPNVPGISQHHGPVIHSSAYRNARTFDRGRVLIIGSGNSAADLAVDLARAEHEVMLSFRTGFNIVPRPRGFALPFIANHLVRWPVTRRLLTSAATRFRGDFGHLGLPTNPHAAMAIGHRLVVGHDLVEMVRSGRVRPMPEVKGFRADSVQFRDGRSSEVNLVILATGFRPAVEFAKNYISPGRDGHLAPSRLTHNTPPLFSIGLSPPESVPEGVLPGLRRASEKLATELLRVLGR